MEREEDLATKLRALIGVWGVEGARAMFAHQAAALPPDARARVAALAFGDHSQMGDISIGNVAGGDMTTGALEVGHDARIDGVAVAVNLGQIIYGRDPGEDERRQLVWYLSRLAAKLRRLPLRGLDPNLDERGRGLDLGKVYTELVIRDVSTLFAEGPLEQILRDYFDGDGSTKVLKAAYHPDNALPSRAAFDIVGVPAGTDEPDNTTNRGVTEPMPAEVFRVYTHPRVYLTRPRLVVERVQRYRCYVLTGSPGSGKSTFLRYLGWELAQRALGQESSVHPDTRRGPPRDSLPILLSLRSLAGRLARDGVSDQTIFAALRDELHSFHIGPAEQLLSEALHRGGARLLLDGLDEVPLEGAPGVTTDRLRTLQAVHQFAQTHEQVSVIVTCRTRAFDERFRDLVGWRHWETRARRNDTDWEVDELAPFTLGQIRHFVPAWYRELVATGQLDASQAAGLERALLDTILGRPRLQALAATPLLLTMMALVLYHDGALPRDRSLLYERILELLLGQWDKVRDGQSLSEAIGQPDWDSDRIRPLLDQLSYQAHAASTSRDGRGRLSRAAVRDGLIGFFEVAGVADAWSAAHRCLTYFEQRSGLLFPDGADTYVFAHLTLQEHCAGRHIFLSPDAAELVVRHRGDDRWREPIMLGLGVVQKTNPALVDRVLSDLIDADEGAEPKPDDRWQRDLILAAELGRDRDWGYLRGQRVRVERLQRDLRRGLAALLDAPRPSLTSAERVAAGAYLGELGDPRIPVAPDSWRQETHRRGARFGAPDGYWCYVRPGAYRVSGWAEGEPACDVTLPSYWIARFPVTVGQFRPFVAVGYASETDCLWTPRGRDWRGEHSEPWDWGVTQQLGANVPVIGVTWYEATAWAVWLTEQLGETLPAGYVARLPTDAEWEVAMSYDQHGTRRRHPWGDEPPNPDLAIYQRPHLHAPLPVGVALADAAPCGARDLAGNVQEWTASAYDAYPDQSHALANDFRSGEANVSMRGSSWKSDETRLMAPSRTRGLPDRLNLFGFRVVLAPRY